MCLRWWIRCACGDVLLLCMYSRDNHVFWHKAGVWLLALVCVPATLFGRIYYTNLLLLLQAMDLGCGE